MISLFHFTDVLNFDLVILHASYCCVFLGTVTYYLYNVFIISGNGFSVCLFVCLFVCLLLFFEGGGQLSIKYKVIYFNGSQVLQVCCSPLQSSIHFVNKA